MRILDNGVLGCGSVYIFILFYFFFIFGGGGGGSLGGGGFTLSQQSSKIRDRIDKQRTFLWRMSSSVCSGQG